MAKTTSELKKILSQYVKELVKLQIQPEKIILFGSYASGKARQWSDIDVSIVSKDLEGKGILERQLLLGRANQDLQAPLDLIGFTLGEIKECEKGTLLSEILKNGLEISLSDLTL